jgi:hypothetical protein
MMQTMSNIYRIVAPLLIFCLSLIVIDLALVIFRAPTGYLYGVGLLLTPPTVYRIIVTLDDVHIGRFLSRLRKRHNRLTRPSH